jgi:hypothetical protein
MNLSVHQISRNWMNLNLLHNNMLVLCPLFISHHGNIMATSWQHPCGGFARVLVLCSVSLVSVNYKYNAPQYEREEKPRKDVARNEPRAEQQQLNINKQVQVQFEPITWISSSTVMHNEWNAESESRPYEKGRRSLR